MKFEEAVELMKKGKKVTRSGWHKGIYFYLNENKIEVTIGLNINYLPNLEATDWELVEEKKKKRLSDKVKAAQFIDEDEIAIPYMAVKEHLKVLIKAINAGYLPSTLLKIVDEEFGDDLI